MISKFKIYHQSKLLGIARMADRSVTFKFISDGYFEKQSYDWMKHFKRIVTRLCQSTGHFSKFSITQEEISGIAVERI